MTNIVNNVTEILDTMIDLGVSDKTKDGAYTLDKGFLSKMIGITKSMQKQAIDFKADLTDRLDYATRQYEQNKDADTDEKVQKLTADVKKVMEVQLPFYQNLQKELEALYKSRFNQTYGSNFKVPVYNMPIKDQSQAYKDAVVILQQARKRVVIA
tara:strand:+ start:3706 stop:4170 length:465 start_codon:yes stop_codon:yes gene_type:complete